MRELFVETCTACNEEDIAYSFDYYILIGQMEVRGDIVCESYGVKVACTNGAEEESVPNITTSIARIDMLLELLRRNFVTPTGLRDVVMDWL